MFLYCDIFIHFTAGITYFDLKAWIAITHGDRFEIEDHSLGYVQCTDLQPHLGSPLILKIFDLYQTKSMTQIVEAPLHSNHCLEAVSKLATKPELYTEWNSVNAVWKPVDFYRSKALHTQEEDKRATRRQVLTKRQLAISRLWRVHWLTACLLTGWASRETDANCRASLSRAKTSTRL